MKRAKHLLTFSLIRNIFKYLKIINWYPHHGKIHRTVQDPSERWNITPRRVRYLRAQGKSEGMFGLGKAWAIPFSTEKSLDRRITTGRYKGWRTQKGNKSNRMIK